MPVTASKTYLHAGEDIFQGRILIKELAGLWFMDIKDIMRPSSYALYQSYADKYILPYIGEMPADSFDTGILSDLLGRLYTGGGEKDALSQYTVYLLESMVRAMFHYGTKKKIIPEVLFGKAEYITVKKKEAMPLTELEIQQLLLTTEKQGEDLQLQVCLPLYAGITLSELCGLKWKDINLKTGEINIHRNLVRIQHNIPSGNGESTDAGTSTAMAECELPENMCRKFVMPGKLSSLLEKVSYEKNPDPENYVAELNKKTGRKRSASMPADAPDGRTLQYRLKAAGEKSGIDGLTFKILRDTFAVMCLQAGGDVYSLAYIMGAGVPALCDRYGQWMVMKKGVLKEIL